MGIPNQSLIQKADLALSELTSGGGKLQPDQAKTFWRDTILGSSFLTAATTRPIAPTGGELPTIAMTDWLSVPSAERTMLTEAQRSKPALGKRTLTPVRFKAEISLSYEQLEDNIEANSLQMTIQTMAAEKVRSEIAIIAVQGNTATTVTDKRTAALKQLNGVIAQATLNQYDANGNRFTKRVAEALFRKMPARYRSKEGVAFMTSTVAAMDFASAQANRQTELGDTMLWKLADARHGSWPVIGFESFPEDLGGSSDKTVALFCNPKNIIIGFGKDVTLEWDKDIRSGEFFVVIRYSFDIALMNPAEIAIATNVLVSVDD